MHYSAGSDPLVFLTLTGQGGAQHLATLDTGLQPLFLTLTGQGGAQHGRHNHYEAGN